MKRDRSQLDTPAPNNTSGTGQMLKSVATNDAGSTRGEVHPPAAQHHTAPNTKSNWRSMSLSLLVHTLLAILLILFVNVPGRGSSGDEAARAAAIVLAVNTDSKTEYLSEESEAESESAEQPTPVASAAASAPPLLELAPPDLPGMRPVTNDNPLNAAAMTESQGKSDSQHELSEEDLKMIAKDQRLIRSRKPKGDPASINVFGLKGISGRRFVFVLDRSNSMGGKGLGVIDMARKELTKAIEALEPNHSFQVVAYHERTTTISKRELLPATEANKAELPKFLGSLAAFGATSHENGLFAGLAFKPDVVVLMTDGGYPELGPAQLKYLSRMARGQTEIHCLQFGSGPNQKTDNFMMQLARDNEGTYRYINVNQWDK